MTAEELFKIWNAWREIEKLRERIQALSSAAINTTKVIDGVPIGTVKNGGDKVGKLSAEIIDTEKKIRQLEEGIAGSAKQLYNFFYKELDTRTATVMFLRYVGCRQWAEISQVMEMSERRIMELHRQAKKKLQSLTA